MKRISFIALIGSCLFISVTIFAQEQSTTKNEPKHLTFHAVPFTDVQITRSNLIKDNAAIWGERLEINRTVSIPHNYDWCDKTGRFTNFAKAAGLMEGKFEGIYFNDSDVYKLLEGTAYSLRVHPDPVLEKRADKVIDWIAAAQLPDGYINSYFQLVEPDKKWTNTKVRHELYCGGHLAEAAVAYAQATGKTKLLDVAEKFMDHIMTVFGSEDGKRVEVPGHEEIELALVKLYQYTGKQKYFDLAKFFVDVRGEQSKRTDKLQGPYSQDHLPIREQSEIVGHAVRAVYLYAGVADVAAYTGDEGYIKAMDRLWNDVVHKKMYITGGIGARHEGEAFGEAFELPNRTAYCETCAAIGLVFWAHRMNLLHGDAQYADVVERAMYNGVLAGIGADGKHFFYVNPLESIGNHHRQPFFDCACCPTNVVRFVPSVPGYIYATDDDGIVVNQFIPNDSVIKMPKAEVSIKMRSEYPWDGTMKFSINVKRHDSESKELIGLKLRIPDWSHYPDEEPKIKLTYTEFGTKKIVDVPYKIEKGYVVASIREEPDFEFEYKIPFTFRRMVANPKVEADRGRVAIQDGPIVYCLEEADNTGLDDRTMIKKDLDWIKDMRAQIGGELSRSLSGMPTIRWFQSSEGKELTAIPYYAWDSRNKPGRMAVWIRQEGLPKDLDSDSGFWKTADGQPRLYQPLPDDKHPYYPRDPRSKPKNCLLVDHLAVDFDPMVTASHCFEKDSVETMLDEGEPKNSNDHSIRRQTFWPRKGTAEWIELSFGKSRKISSVSVYWFDDTGKGGCRIPKSVSISFKKGDVWQKIEQIVGCEKDKYNTVRFDAVETTALRLDVELQDGFSGGVLRLKTE